jgi:hypothetical protein
MKMMKAPGKAPKSGKTVGKKETMMKGGLKKYTGNLKGSKAGGMMKKSK